MKIQNWCLVTLSLLLTFSLPVNAALEMLEEENSYVFDTDMHTIDAPIAYTVTETLRAEDFGESSAIAPDDISVGYDGSIYIADSTAGKVHKLTADRKTTACLQTFEINGETETLQNPTGVFARQDGQVFVADSGTRRIYVFDENFQYQRHIEPPTKDETLATQEYIPLKVSADQGDRVYVVAKDQTQGILQFSAEGKFFGYLGATRVNPSLLDMFLVKIATPEQRRAMLRLIPTEYNNLTLDEDDFVYATIGSLDEYTMRSEVNSGGGTVTPIRRLNPKGIDTLIRNGAFPPVGDVNFLPPVGETSEYTVEASWGASRIEDVACRKNNVYSLLDSRYGKVFTYNRSGELLFVFGNSNAKGQTLVKATAIDYWGNSVVVSDVKDGCVRVFTPTEYAEKILMAIDYHEIGEYDKEAAIWTEVHREYIGSELAYLGLARTALNDKNYKQAMEYFRLAKDKESYSKVYELYRKEWGYANIGWLIGGVVVACVLIYAVSYIMRKRKLAHDGDPETLWQRIGYAKYVLAHPFKGFYELKRSRIGTTLSATVILVAVAVLKMLQVATAPYLLQGDTKNNPLFQGAVGIVLLVLLFVSANWCLTTLMDGKGTFRDIYIYTCYSLFPMLMIMPIQIVLNQIISLDEVALYNFLGGVAVALALLLIFFGTIVVHEYSAGKTVLVLIMTVIGMMILVFIAMLCFTLAQQIIIFVRNIIAEIQLR